MHKAVAGIPFDDAAAFQRSIVVLSTIRSADKAIRIRIRPFLLIPRHDFHRHEGGRISSTRLFSDDIAIIRHRTAISTQISRSSWQLRRISCSSGKTQPLNAIRAMLQFSPPQSVPRRHQPAPGLRHADSLATHLDPPAQMKKNPRISRLRPRRAIQVVQGKFTVHNAFLSNLRNDRWVIAFNELRWHSGPPGPWAWHGFLGRSRPQTLKGWRLQRRD